MAIAPNHWSSMDLKRLLMYLTDLGETQISMFSNFCHVVNRQGFIDRFEYVAMSMCIQVGKEKIYLNHFPYLCFEGGYHNDVWQLFGHVHTRPSNTGIDGGRLQYLFPTQLDVGVDNNNFMPLSFDEVRAKIQRQIESN